MSQQNDTNELKKFLNTILEKRRNCIQLTDAEQKQADEILGKLFDKKFGDRHFIVQTGDDIRKAAGKPANVQPDKEIADERSKPAKSQKIKDEDNSGKVKEEETGDNVNVDEKRVGGKDSAEKEATATNASDIINSDKEDLQRKPVLKLGDVVITKVFNQFKAGVVLKVYDKQNAAQIKWADGTFSVNHISALEKVADKKNEEESHEPPVSADTHEGVKTPGTDTASENQGLAVNKAESAEDLEDEIEELEDKVEELEDTEKAEDGKWMSDCEKAFGKNEKAENPKALCEFVRAAMSKSEDTIIKMDIEEVRKSNPKLADWMEKEGHGSITYDRSKPFEV